MNKKLRRRNEDVDKTENCWEQKELSTKNDDLALFVISSLQGFNKFTYFHMFINTVASASHFTKSE